MDSLLTTIPAEAVPTILACIAILILAGIVKGTIGIGLPLVGMPLLMLMVDVRVAIGLLLVPLVLANVIQAIEGHGTVALIKRFAGLLIAIAVGTWIGTSLFAALDRHVLLLTIGPLAIVMASASMLQPNLAMSSRVESWVGPPVGFVSGVVGGMSTLFGPLLAIYVTGLRLPRDVFVKFIAILYTTASLSLLVGGVSHGTAGPGLLTLSVLGMLPVYLGMRLGRTVRHHIDPEWFRFIVLGVVWLSGVNMIRLGLGY